MTIRDDDLADLADRIMRSSTDAAVVHRACVDGGDLTIVHVEGDELDTHILIVTDPDNGDLVSIAVYAFAEEDIDAAYHTLETIDGMPYAYSGIGRAFIDVGDECVDGAAALIYVSPDRLKQGGGGHV